MNLAELVFSKSMGAKQKVEAIAEALVHLRVRAEDLAVFSENLKDGDKANCIEGLEFASKQNPELVNETVFKFVCVQLSAKAPRVKWESAKVVANSVHLHQKHIALAIDALLANTSHAGTVVRWSAAYALAAIYMLKTPYTEVLANHFGKIAESDEKNSIKKIYQAAQKQK